MRISGFERRSTGGRVRVQARVAWEQNRRSDDEVWVETAAEFADGFDARPEAFLLPCLVPAMERGERRVLVEGTLCSVLGPRVRAALRTVRRWSPSLAIPEIEATEGLRPRLPAPEPCVATTFSGGVDSLAAVRANRLALPLDHPGSLRRAYFVLGMNTHDVVDGVPAPARVRDFDARWARWRPLAQEASLEIVPVVSTFRSLAVHFPSWARFTIGAALAGVAHAFSGVTTRMLLPSAGSEDPLEPDGCHPMLDPFYSSSALEVESDGLDRTRIGKLRLVADWPAALEILQPCQQHELEVVGINCGRCSKCHRTMVALEAIGRTADAASFPRVRIDAAFLGGVRIANEFDVQCHRESAALFRDSGRPDLARALERRVAAWKRRKRLRAWRRLLRVGRRGAATPG